MFTTDTALQVRTDGTAFFGCHTYQLAYTILVEYLERVYFQNLLLQINRKERSYIVTRVTESHLSQVVGSEREELGRRSDTVGSQSCTGNFDHGSDFEVDAVSHLFKELVCFGTNHTFLLLELVKNTCQRHHNFGMCLYSFFLQFKSGTQNGTSLHLCDFGIRISQTATTVTQHRVVFAERFDTLLDILQAYSHCIGHLLLSFQIVRNKFMQRRIEQTYSHRTTGHCLEDSLEVGLLIWQDLGKSFAASLSIFCQNHLTHGFDLFTFEEHVFRTAKTDTYRTEITGNFGIMRSVGIGTNLQTGIFISQLHQIGKVA